MEGKNQVGTTSSLTSELFGPKDPFLSSSSGTFDSIFAPSSKVSGTDSLPSRVGVKTGTEDGNIRGNNENGNKSTPNKDMSSIYQEGSVEPCHFSSSIYYGGQEVYAHPQKTENAGFNPLNEKDGDEDDSGSASRGNWWQGSLYY